MSAAPTITVIPHPRGGWTHGVSVPGTSRKIYVGQWDTAAAITVLPDPVAAVSEKAWRSRSSRQRFRAFVKLASTSRADSSW